MAAAKTVAADWSRYLSKLETGLKRVPIATVTQQSDRNTSEIQKIMIITTVLPIITYCFDKKKVRVR